MAQLFALKSWNRFSLLSVGRQTTGWCFQLFFFKFHLEVWGRLRPDPYFSGWGCRKTHQRPSGYQFAFVLPVGFVYFGALYGIMLHPVWKLKFLESFHQKNSDFGAMNLGTPTKNQLLGHPKNEVIVRIHKRIISNHDLRSKIGNIC